MEFFCPKNGVFDKNVWHLSGLDGKKKEFFIFPEIFGKIIPNFRYLEASFPTGIYSELFLLLSAVCTTYPLVFHLALEAQWSSTLLLAT